MKFNDRFQALKGSTLLTSLSKISRGIEKEGLRVDSQSFISSTDHPKALGATLTHPYITTDYSEALLEFISPVCDDIPSLIEFIDDLHTFTCQQLKDDEFFWFNSMPCLLGDQESIRIAEYGKSNVGMMKHIYRRGLSWRYGRHMQTIAGLHFNLSFPKTFWQGLHEQSESKLGLDDFISESYMGLVRNFRRYSWILHYLFGATPVAHESFLNDAQKKDLEVLAPETYGLPYATSLRMSNIGYTNESQQELLLCYNSLENYAYCLNKAIETPSEEFAKIGVKVDGEYRQLNSNLLQIENEFYNPIRPKRTPASMEKPTAALLRAGIEYIEVRSLDLDPFCPRGISEEQIRFIDSFLLFCLLEESPDHSPAEHKIIARNNNKITAEGRRPNLSLEDANGAEIPFKDYAKELMSKISASAELLDEAYQSEDYKASIAEYSEYLDDSSLCPSARVIANINNSSFIEAMTVSSKGYTEVYKNNHLSAERQALLEKAAHESIQKFDALQEVEEIDFDTFLADYLADKVEI